MATKKKKYIDPHTGKPTDRKPPERGEVDRHTGKPVKQEPAPAPEPAPVEPTMIDGTAFYPTKKAAVEARPDGMPVTKARELTFKHPGSDENDPRAGLWTFAPEPPADDKPADDTD